MAIWKWHHNGRSNARRWNAFLNLAKRESDEIHPFLAILTNCYCFTSFSLRQIQGAFLFLEEKSRTWMVFSRSLSMELSCWSLALNLSRINLLWCWYRTTWSAIVSFSIWKWNLYVSKSSNKYYSEQLEWYFNETAIQVINWNILKFCVGVRDILVMRYLLGRTIKKGGCFQNYISFKFAPKI